MKIKNILAAFSALLLISGHVAGAPFSALYAFGDSLSDVGSSDSAAMSLYKILGNNCDPSHLCPPYFDGRKSDGPVASEYLAGALFPSGVTATNFHSYAVAGANSGDSNSGFNAGGLLNLPGIQQEVGNYLEDAQGKADPSALYFLWGGANDYVGGDPAAKAAQNIAGYVSTLAGVGAKNILVPNLADLSLTPFGQGDALQAHAFSLTFNSELATQLGNVQHEFPNTHIFSFDSYSLLNDVVQHPDKYGFTNTSDPCLTALIPCGNPDHHVWWDDFHPTARADSIIGTAFASAVPEPEVVSMLIAGFVVLGFAGAKRRRVEGRSERGRAFKFGVWAESGPAS